MKWGQLTEANTGRHVAVEINETFMFAPKINAQINDGSGSITGLLPEEINLLFNGVARAQRKQEADYIEVIEIK